MLSADVVYAFMYVRCVCVSCIYRMFVYVLCMRVWYARKLCMCVMYVGYEFMYAFVGMYVSFCARYV